MAQPRPSPYTGAFYTEQPDPTVKPAKKYLKSPSDVFAKYTKEELKEYKEGFEFFDHDGDGIISKHDLRATFNAIGRVAEEEEINEMLNEAKGPCNFVAFLWLFYDKLMGAGSTGDDDDAITAAFEVFEDKDGTIDQAKFKEQLMSGAVNLKFSEKECKLAWGEMEINNGRINSKLLTEMLTSANLDEEPEEEEEEEAEEE